MSYIESHQDLEDHFKTLDLMGALNLDLDTTIGRLHRFWWWCVKYAETGYLSKHPAARLDAKFGAGFVEAMKKAGFIDAAEYRVHDWTDWQGRYLLTRYRTRRPLYVAGIFLAYGRRDDAEALLTQAVKLLRITQAQADQLLGDRAAPAGGSAIEKGQTLERLTEKTPEMGKKTASRTDFAERLMKKAGSEVEKFGQETPKNSGNSSQLNPSQPSEAQPTPSTSGGGEVEGDENQLIPQPPNVAYEGWLAAYPRRVALKAARKAWDKLAPDGKLVARMMRALEAQKAADAALKGAGKFAPAWPNPARYIIDERWNDEIAALPSSPAIAGPPAGEKYSPSTPLQCLVCVFKMIKGVEMEDRGWDASNWAAAEPHAKHLLTAFDGDDKAAAVWLEAYGQDMDRMQMTKWTLKSAAERAWNTKGERVLAGSPKPAAAPRGDGTVSAEAVILEQPDRHFISAAEEK